MNGLGGKLIPVSVLKSMSIDIDYICVKETDLIAKTHARIALKELNELVHRLFGI